MPNKKLKDVPEGNAGKGLRSLDVDVRNNMGYKMSDEVYKMAQIAGKPAMPMSHTDRLYANDPEDKKVRPLFATESNKSLFTETSKSGNTITYDTTTDGRPVIYSVGTDVPGNIKQRFSTSSAEDAMSKPDYIKNIPADGSSNIPNYLNYARGGAAQAEGDFKRQVENKPISTDLGFGNTEIRSSASIINPRSGKPISFGSSSDVDKYKYSSDYMINQTKNLKNDNRKFRQNFVSSEKVQSNIDQAVKDYRSGSESTLKNLKSGIVNVQPEQPKIESFATVDFNAKPSRPEKKKGPGLLKVVGDGISDLNLFRPARYKGARIKGKGKSRSGSSFRYRGGRGGGRRSNRFTRN
mgnify:CR=1 FL=1|tara:strand:+ start:812 stop:1867 length:1056 start_codon:yes stop_codon:yes gene_type:complete